MDLLPATSWTTYRKNAISMAVLPVVSTNDTRGKVVHTDNARGNNHGAKTHGSDTGCNTQSTL